jgi:thiol-disulfide isomerase/thioredoxin
MFFNFIVTGIINFLFTFYLLKINPYKKLGLFLIFLPFLLLTSTVIYGLINSERMPGIIGYFMYLFSSTSGLILFLSRKKRVVIFIYFILLSLSILNYNNFINYYYSIVDQNTSIGKNLPEIEILNSKNELQILNNNGKILVVDLWSNTCGNCIKDFPKFEKLKNDFANDSLVDFISINIYNKKSDITESEKYLKKYTFKKYFTDRSVYKKLDFNSIPNYMLVGKDGKIKYFGNLNMETYETYNNIYKLIENEK